jgi:hypothetical protein
MRSILYICQITKTMYNKLIAFCAASLISLSIFSQSPFPTPDEIESFYGTETLVVLENTMFSTYNAFIKSAMEEHWEITPYKFVSGEEFNTKREDPSYSFLVMTETKFDKDKSGSVYNFLNLVLGKDVGRIEDLPEMCAIPLSFAGEEDVEYGYKVGIVLRFMQAHVRHLSEDPSLKGKKYLKYYNKFVPSLADKTILLSEDDLVEELRSESALKDLYDNDIKMVGEEEVRDAIINKEENTLVLHMVGPEGSRSGGLCFKMLIGADDGMIYFYGEHKISPKKKKGLLVNDMKRIGRF